MKPLNVNESFAAKRLNIERFLAEGYTAPAVEILEQRTRAARTSPARQKRMEMSLASREESEVAPIDELPEPTGIIAKAIRKKQQRARGKKALSITVTRGGTRLGNPFLGSARTTGTTPVGTSSHMGRDTPSLVQFSSRTARSGTMASTS